MKRLREWSAARRWRRSNAFAQAAGCKCGAPATHVQRYGTTVGSVPFERWTCEAHQDVNRWSRRGDTGFWDPVFPTPEEKAALDVWRVWS